MPDKTHFDLETLILLIMAMLNPMVAVFMMKGCGIEFVFCLLLFILLLVPLVSVLLSTYPLTLNALASLSLGSLPISLSPIVTRERSLASLSSSEILRGRRPGPMLFSCRGPAPHLLLLFRPSSTGLNQCFRHLHLHPHPQPRPRLHLQLRLQSKSLWSQKHLTQLHLLSFQCPLQSEHELWETIDVDDTTAL
jgi:uncharacterized membrane protein YqaE (UPF0057 family)